MKKGVKRAWLWLQKRAKGEAKGREEGRVEGLAEGRAEGRNEEKIRIAKVLKEEGVDFLVIANATGLSKNEIAML